MMTLQDEVDIINNSHSVKVYERMLHDTVVKEVINEIENMVMPSVNEKIKVLATAAVSKWAIHIRAQKTQGAYNMKTEINIDFVEEVINKVFEESPITIKTNEKKV